VLARVELRRAAQLAAVAADGVRANPHPPPTSVAGMLAVTELCDRHPPRPTRIPCDRDPGRVQQLPHDPRPRCVVEDDQREDPEGSEAVLQRVRIRLKACSQAQCST
jgi:hypothetical protein